MPEKVGSRGDEDKIIYEISLSLQFFLEKASEGASLKRLKNLKWKPLVKASIVDHSGVSLGSEHP